MTDDIRTLIERSSLGTPDAVTARASVPDEVVEKVMARVRHWPNLARPDWRENAGRALLDPNDPRGEPLTTPLDRRWLWRIESMLTVSGTTETHRTMQRDLRAYLNETCEHHWLPYDGDDQVPAHRQCLWCCDVLWDNEGGAS